MTVLSTKIKKLKKYTATYMEPIDPTRSEKFPSFFA